MSTTLVEGETDLPSSDVSQTTGADTIRPNLIRRMAARATGMRKLEEEALITESPLLAEGESSAHRPKKGILFDLPKFADKPKAPKMTFVALQEWEGYVVVVEKDVFTARLVDITAGGDLEMEEADIPVSDVYETDRDLLKPGGIFRWSIGYIRRSGTKVRASQIVFRQLPQWRDQDLDEARKQAEELAAAIPLK